MESGRVPLVLTRKLRKKPRSQQQGSEAQFLASGESILGIHIVTFSILAGERNSRIIADPYSRAALRASFRLLCLLCLSVASASAIAAPLCEGPPSAVAPFLPDLPKGCQRDRVSVTGELSFNLFRTAAGLAESAWEREVFTKFGERFHNLAFAACKNISCVRGAVSGTERCTVTAYPCASDMDASQREQVARLATMDAQPPQPQPDETLRRKEKEDEARRREEKGREEKEREAAREKASRDQEERERLRENEEKEKQDNEKRKQAEEQKQAEEHKEPQFEDRNLTIPEVREMQRYLARAGFNVRPDGVFGDESRDALSAWERGKGLPDNGYPTVEMLERLRREFR